MLQLNEIQIKAKLEELMLKYGVKDLYAMKSNNNPLDLNDGLDLFVDGDFTGFKEEVCKTFTDPDSDIYSTVGSIPKDKSRDRVFGMLQSVYREGELVCQQKIR